MNYTVKEATGDNQQPLEALLLVEACRGRETAAGLILAHPSLHPDRAPGSRELDCLEQYTSALRERVRLVEQ